MPGLAEMSDTETVRRKYRSGERKRRTRKRLERQFYSTVSEQPREPVLEIPEAELSPTPEGQGESPKPLETALFERPQDTRPDANLVRKAVKQRWKPPSSYPKS